MSKLKSIHYKRAIYLADKFEKIAREDTDISLLTPEDRKDLPKIPLTSDEKELGLDVFQKILNFAAIHPALRWLDIVNMALHYKRGKYIDAVIDLIALLLPGFGEFVAIKNAGVILSKSAQTAIRVFLLKNKGTIAYVLAEAIGILSMDGLEYIAKNPIPHIAKWFNVDLNAES